VDVWASPDRFGPGATNPARRSKPEWTRRVPGTGDPSSQNDIGGAPAPFPTVNLVTWRTHRGWSTPSPERDVVRIRGPGGARARRHQPRRASEGLRQRIETTAEGLAQQRLLPTTE
jgi:hypothetical protein